MALKDSVLNIVIKAQNLASKTLQAFRADIDKLDASSTSASDAVEDLGGSAKKTGDAVQSASRGVDKMEGSLDGVESAASDTARNLGSAEAALRDLSGAGDQSSRSIDKAGTSAQKLAQRYDAAGKPIDSARESIRKNNAELNKVSNSGTKAGSSIAALAKRFLGLVAAAVGIRTITGKLQEMLATGDKFEKLGMQMEQAMGSIAGGKQATEWVTQFAQDTPLQMTEVTETFTRLKNFGIDPMNGSMQAIVDQASALGGGFERVEGISLALGQAWAKQKLQGEEILQLIERGVPVWDLLEKATGKNALELQKLSAAGALGRDVIQQLMDEMGKANAGAAAKNMTLLSGYVSNLKDEWALFLNQIAQSGALDYVKDQLRGVLDTIKQMRTDGRLDELAQKISDGFVTIAEATKGVVLAIKDNIGAVALLSKAYIALKLADVAKGAVSLASTLGGALVNGTRSAAAATTMMATAMRAVPWLAVLASVQHVANAFFDLIKAKREYQKSLDQGAAAETAAAKRIADFNKETGLAATSLDDLIRAQDDGIAKLDEATGKWVLLNDEMRESEGVQRAQAEAAKAVREEQAQLLSIYDDLIGKFRASKDSSEGLTESIAKMAEQAKGAGQKGIEALSLAFERLVISGEATKEELSAGLGEYLSSLSGPEYTRFGKLIEGEFNRIQNSADTTSNRLSFISTVLGGELIAAAKRAGVDIGEVLKGVDDESQQAIARFQDLAESLKGTGLSADESNKLITAGLLETLKSLDTSQEVKATEKAIQDLGASGVISAQQVAQLLDVLRQKNSELNQQTKDAADTQVQGNAQITESVLITNDSLHKQAEEMANVGGAATALKAIYDAVRNSVASLGPAAVAAFDQIRGVDSGADRFTGEFADLEKVISEANNELAQLRLNAAVDVTGISRFMDQLGRDAATVKKEYAEQKISLERLKQGYEDGSISSAEFAHQAQGALYATSLLGQQDLAYLRNAIKDAELQMERFRDSTMGTLNSLQAELAQLQGQQAEVERLNYEARVAQLEKQLEAANRTGDSQAIANAQQALDIARQIYDVKIQQNAAQQQAAADQKAAAEAELTQVNRDKENAATTKPPKPTTLQPTNTTRIILEDSKGDAVELDTENPDGLISILEKLGRRVAG